MKKIDVMIIIMMLGTFGILSTELGMIGILPQIAEYFQVTIDQAGLFVSLFSLIIAITSIFIPIIFSKYDRKKTFILVLGMFSLFSFIGAIIKDFQIALICRMIPAFFYPAYCSLTFTVAEEIMEEDRVQMAISKILMGVSAGTIVGVPITTFITISIGYQATMIFYGILNLSTLIATLAYFPTLPGKENSSLEQLKSTKSKLFIISAIGVVILTTGVCISYSYISQFLQTITYIVGLNLSITLFFFGISSIIGTYVGGKLLTLKANTTVLFYPFILSFTLLLIYLLGRQLIPTIILVIIWGALDGIMNNILQYWMTTALPETPELANGMFFSMMNIGITIGTSIGGLLIITNGTMSIFIGSIIVLIISSIILALRIKKYPHATRTQ